MKAIGKKILAVMKEVGPITKDARNEFHKYDYVSDAAVVRAMRDAMINNGLVLIPSHVASHRDAIATDLTQLTVEYTLIDTDSGESIKSFAMGDGADKGDKGIFKAMTGAEKYYLTKTFLIPTEDDPEKDSTKKSAPLKTSVSWDKPKSSTQLEKPTTPVTQAMKDILQKNFGIPPNANEMVDEILERLNQEADGDEEQVALLLKEATTWTPKGTTEQKWLKPEDLARIAKSKPEWIERIHSRIVTN